MLAATAYGTNLRPEQPLAVALRIIEAETLATRYRLRAIEDRWIPRLEQALAEVTLALEEQELADAARLRLAVSPGRTRDAR